MNDLKVAEVNSPEVALHESIHTGDIIETDYGERLLVLQQADPDALNSAGLAPLHVAAEGGLSDVLESLLNRGASLHKLTSRGETALHCALRGVARVGEQQALECIQLLVAADIAEEIDINAISDVPSSETHSEIPSGSLSINIDSNFSQIKNCDRSAGFTVVHIAAMNNLWQIVNYFIHLEADIDIDFNGETARDLIMKKNPNLIDKFAVSVSNVKDLFQLLKEGKESHFLQALWASTGGLDIAKDESRNDDDLTLLQTAVRHGFVKATRKLVEIGMNSQDDLIKVFMYPNPNIKCFKLLLTKLNLDINYKDDKGNTALHYAAKKDETEFIKFLLKHNANIFILNDEDIPAFHYVKFEVLNDYLDTNISVDNKVECHDPNFSLILDYNFLASYAHIKDDGKETSPEMGPLLMIAKSPKHCQILSHPLIRCFLLLKWYRCYYIFYINLLIFFMFTLSLSKHIFSIIKYEGLRNETSASTQEFLLFDDQEFAWWWPTFILTLCLMYREILQVCHSPMRYVFELQNWLEMGLMILTIILLCEPQSQSSRHSISAVAILLAYSELLLLLGSHPVFATYINIFLRVSKSFILFLIWYSLFIVAFAFSFYIIFHQCESVEKCDGNFFAAPGISIFKTIIMLTGEFESTDLKFDTNSITSHVIFLLFLFFIAIILLNLLNGLAISDTQVILDQEEIVGYISQVQLYAKIETTLLGSGGKTITNLLPFLNNCNIFRYLGNKVIILNLLLPENNLKIFLNQECRMKPDVRYPFRKACASGVKMALGKNPWRFCVVFNRMVSDALAVVAPRPQQGGSRELLERLTRLQRIGDARAVVAQRKHRNDTRHILATLEKQKRSLENLGQSLQAIARAVNAKIEA